MEKKLPETLFYDFRWHVYQTTNRQSPAFSRTNDNLLSYDTLVNLKNENGGNETFKTYLEREILTQRAINRNETKVDYHEPSYKSALIAASLSLISLITTTTTFLTALTKNSNSVTTLNELDSTKLDDIKNTASAFALFSSNTNNFTLSEVIDLINKALDKGIELTTLNLNNTLSVTKQPQSNNLNSNVIISVAFAVGVVATLTSFVFTIISLQKKSVATQKKQLFDAQKKLIERLPKIKLEIDLKERVIKGMFKLLGVEKPENMSDEIFLREILFITYNRLISVLDNLDDLNCYSELKDKIEFLLNASDQKELLNYKNLIFNDLKREIYQKTKNVIGRYMLLHIQTWEEFNEHCFDFDHFYNEVIHELTVIPDRYIFIYNSLVNLIDKYVSQLKSETLNSANVQKTVLMANHNDFVKNPAQSSSFSLFFEEKQNTKRDKLHDEKIVKQKLVNYTPKNYQLGAAIERGDCFFDAMAQALNLLKETKQYTAKSLRLLCDKYAKSGKYPWVEQAFKDDSDDFYSYLVRIPFTAEELEKEEKENTGLKLSDIVWGRPEIEGRMLCEIFNIKLHVIGVLEASYNGSENKTDVVEQLIDANGMDFEHKSFAQELYNSSNIIHLVNYKYHFVPLLNSTKNQPEKSSSLLEKSDIMDKDTSENSSERKFSI